MTLKRLIAQQLKKIQDVKIFLVHASTLTGVPWQAIASVWYRESFSVAPPKTPGGPFQFDPLPSIGVRKGLLRDFTKCTPTDEAHYLSRSLDDFETGALFAACWLDHQSKYNLKTDHSDEAIKDAFYGYNGRAWGPHPESSPYVYNEFDEKHKAMKIRGSIPLKGGGRKFISTIDLRPGAFTVYKQLIDAKI